jgi:inorganic triphosphatase YgiF
VTGRPEKESEIKLLLGDEDARALRGRLGDPSRVLRQVSHFYDTAEDHLARAGVSLRVREESVAASHEGGAAPGPGAGRVLLTVKEAGLRAGALMVRPEVESEVARSDWEDVRLRRKRFAELDLAPVGRLKELLGGLDGLDLAPLGRIENRREVYNLRAEEMTFEVLLDRTLYPDGCVEFELESELAQAAAGEGARVLRRLFEELGIDWRPADVGKYVRFRRRIGRDPGP